MARRYPGRPTSGAGLRLAARPNPTRAGLTVEFTVPRDVTGSLALYDVSGRRVKTLVNGPMSAGAHQVSWDTGSLPNGMYFYRMMVDSQMATKKLLIVK